MATRAAVVGNLLLVAVSIAITVLVCEVGARFVLKPADYLSVETQPDGVLGMKITPGSKGFDDWGFRNATVPQRADVVAVGDSHTFGNTAKMDEAWPAVLASSTGSTVYNLGMGGYGPNQYFELMRTRAVALKPKWVICGFYMGDDFENAFSITYGLDHWKDLRQGDWTVDPNIWGTVEPPGAFKQMRNWLSRNSLLYQITVHGPLLASFKERMELTRAAKTADPAVTTLVIAEKNISEAFRPVDLAKRVDQESRPVQEGMRITFRLLGDMKRLCETGQCRFGVVIIPTKETVFADELMAQDGLPLKDAVHRLITNEREAREKLGAFLDSERIPYVDALPDLKAARGQKLYAQTANDMHPGKNGYRIIGQAAARLIESN